jgi:hypothetical protein
MPFPEVAERGGVGGPARAGSSVYCSGREYQNYDLAEVPRDDSLSERVIRVANRIIARMGPDTVTAILSRAPEASAALAGIPVGASPDDQDADIPWQAVNDLYTPRSRVFPGWVYRASLRSCIRSGPALVPILDSVVDQYLSPSEDTDAGYRLARGDTVGRTIVTLVRSRRKLLGLLEATQRPGWQGGPEPHGRTGS